MQRISFFNRLLPPARRQFLRPKRSAVFSFEPSSHRQFRNTYAFSANSDTSLLNLSDCTPFKSRVRQLEISTRPRYVSTQTEAEPAKALQKAPSRDLLLSPPALVVTRDYEWANIIIGFEQANRYTIRAAPGGEVVGFLAEVCSKSLPLIQKL